MMVQFSIIIMPRGGTTAYGSSFVFVTPSVTSVLRRTLNSKL